MKATPEQPYPRTFEEFLEWFSSEEDCARYLEWVRWPQGFICPKCSAAEGWRTERGLWHCKQCGRQTSATAGTVFEDSRKPLRLWFHVMWLLMAQKTGMSAKNLCDTYGFGSYQTAWGWLQKLRSVMVRSGRERLSGEVEVDETFIGGTEVGVKGRNPLSAKVLVAIAVEFKKDRLGRVRFRCISDASGESLEAFVTDNVEPGSRVTTDGWLGYAGLKAAGYAHHRKIASGKSKREAAEIMPHVHLVASLLKRWLGATHQGAVTPAHLQVYLNEFAFRFNRRLSRHRGKLFYRLVQQCVTARPPAVKDLYASSSQPVGVT
jgi:transposase-like protein